VDELLRRRPTQPLFCSAICTLSCSCSALHHCTVYSDLTDFRLLSSYSGTSSPSFALFSPPPKPTYLTQVDPITPSIRPLCDYRYSTQGLICVFCLSSHPHRLPLSLNFLSSSSWDCHYTQLTSDDGNESSPLRLTRTPPPPLSIFHKRFRFPFDNKSIVRANSVAPWLSKELSISSLLGPPHEPASELCLTMLKRVTESYLGRVRSSSPLPWTRLYTTLSSSSRCSDPLPRRRQRR
jgi:hypothetical protein